MKINLVFCDIKSNFVKAVKKESRKHSNGLKDMFTVQTFTGDIREIKVNQPCTAYVSPANSFGYMDGGIDAVYMEMFEGIEQKVMNELKVHKLTTALGRHYQPIGSALLVRVSDTQYLISAPTMWLPENVSKTRNAYWAFRAILHLLYKANRKLPKKKRIRTVICPGLCTGCGFMPPKISASQIFQAIDDHCAGQEYPDKTFAMPFKVLHDIYPETT